jgi:hypothetical protein
LPLCRTQRHFGGIRSLVIVLLVAISDDLIDFTSTYRPP